MRVFQNEAKKNRSVSMAIEVEQKFRVADVPSLRRQLAALGASEGATDLQVDSYFAHPTRDFGFSDEALRLRRVGLHNYLTYKGPKLDAVTKTRREIEIAMADGERVAHDAAKLLEALSFKRVADVCKCRLHYTLVWQNREVEVSLDHIEGLGDFVELEVMATRHNVDEAREAIAGLAERLNLSNSERRSYLELLLTAGHDAPQSREQP
jgi:adenylate cyclase class 2